MPSRCGSHLLGVPAAPSAGARVGGGQERGELRVALARRVDVHRRDRLGWRHRC